MTIGIIGFGRFGKLLAQHLSSGNKVLVYQHNTDYKRSKRYNVEFCDLAKTARCETVILAVPISKMEKILKSISSRLQPGSLVIDVCSVKLRPVKWLKRHLPKEVDAVGTHPLFGPDSIKAGIKNPKTIICPIRLSLKNSKKLKAVFSPFRSQLQKYTPQKHDQDAAYSLSLVHLIGRGLAGLGIRSVKTDTLGYSYLLSLSKNVSRDTLQLFYEMNKYNPYSAKIRNDFLRILKNLNDKLKIKG